MKKKVASIMRYKGDLEKALKWLHGLPTTYEDYALQGIMPGDMLLWTKEYGLQIIIP